MVENPLKVASQSTVQFGGKEQNKQQNPVHKR